MEPVGRNAAALHLHAPQPLRTIWLIAKKKCQGSNTYVQRAVVFYWSKMVICFLKSNLIESRSQRKYILSPFPLTWSAIYSSTLFRCELQRCRYVWRYRLERYLPSHDYNCTRWHRASGVYSAKEYNKNSTAKSFSINQDPNTQDNT